MILGFIGVGAMNGGVLLARTAAADMYPPERKARAISYVLFGALFGAALGPLVFRPLFAGKDFELDTLVIPWFVAAAMALVGLIIALNIRPDPRTIALELAGAGPRRAARPRAGRRAASARSCGGRACPSAVIAAIASFAVMAGVMNLTGYIVVGHHHAQADVFTVISLHIVGMYALVLVIGALVDRVGRRPTLLWGLAIMAVSTVMLAFVESIAWMSVSLFLLGLGWNLSYISATAELVTYATPVERGRLVGFTDLVGGPHCGRARAPRRRSPTRSGASSRSRSARRSRWSSRLRRSSSRRPRRRRCPSRPAKREGRLAAPLVHAYCASGAWLLFDLEEGLERGSVGEHDPRSEAHITLDLGVCQF